MHWRRMLHGHVRLSSHAICFESMLAMQLHNISMAHHEESFFFFHCSSKHSPSLFGHCFLLMNANVVPCELLQRMMHSLFYHCSSSHCDSMMMMMMMMHDPQQQQQQQWWNATMQALNDKTNAHWFAPMNSYNRTFCFFLLLKEWEDAAAAAFSL